MPKTNEKKLILIIQYKMNSDSKSKGIHIKIRICYYSDYIININDLNLDILLVEKSHENILVYNAA